MMQPISMWGGREPKNGERWDFWGYGQLTTRPENVSEEQHRKNRQVALILVAGGLTLFAVVAGVAALLVDSVFSGVLIAFGVFIAFAFVLIVAATLVDGVRAARGR